MRTSPDFVPPALGLVVCTAATEPTPNSPEIYPLLLLNDNSYNAKRHVQTGHPVRTGNPYAKLIAGLMEQGVQIELCGATATANHWVNANLLPE